MCWVMPPASPAATSVERIASKSDVLPWSTWPMMVTTGGRETSEASSSAASNRPVSTSDSATERGDGTFALLVGAECGDEGQPAALLLRPAAGGLGGRRRTRGARTAPGRARSFFLIRLGDLSARKRTQLGLGFFLAESFLRLLLGLALGLFLVAATVLLLALAGVGRIALGTLASLPFGTAAGLLLGDLALLRLADAKIGQRMGAGTAFFLGQRPQHHARRFQGRRRRRGRCGGRSGRRLGGTPA